MSGSKKTSPVSIVVDMVLCAAFFTLMYSIVSSHVPSRDSSMVILWGGLTAACMSVVFWLTIQMFRAVFRAQREASARR